MTTGQLVLIIALVLVAAVLVALILRRSSQRREEHRVEAEELRSEAGEVAASTTGLAAFAEQAEERAGLARAEADEKVAEAERLEAEAAGQQRAAEETRQEYESMMRRADDIDPDVKESHYPPVGEDGAPAAEEEPAHDEPEEPATAPDAPADDEGLPMTRAERRRAREEAEARESEEAAWASGPAAPVAGAAAAAAVGTAAWASREDDGATDAEREQSARIASAADYRDDIDDGEVWTPSPVGTGEGMSQSSLDDASATADAGYDARGDDAAAHAAADAESPSGEWGGPREGGPTEAADTGSAVAPTTEEDTTMAEPQDTDEHVDTTEGREGGAPPGADDTTRGTDLGSGMTMLSESETESFAATEPVLAEDHAPPVEPERAEHPGTGLLDREPGDGADEAGASEDEDLPAAGATPDHGTHAEDVGESGTEAVVLADADRYASPEPELADGSRAEAREDLRDDRADEAGASDEPGADDGIVAGDADDPQARDWGHDEGDLLDENRERGEQLAADREALEREAEAGQQPPTDAERPGGDEPAAEEAAQGRRVSDFHEIRDGGFGVGSAAPLDDGAQPMDHPVAGYRDTMSFRTPGDPGYDDVDPDVWFYDEGAAEGAGFHRSDG